MQDRPAGASAWIPAPPEQGHREMAMHTGLQVVAQHHLSSFNSSLRSLHDRCLRLSSPFDSSSSTQGSEQIPAVSPTGMGYVSGAGAWPSHL